ncbi:hypothetical protein LWI29_038328 [Acer saccharum]|uniref:Uncharacterized protein n=1 Tax=Acer saccharum TaxID=4024 RepID=A0AA39S9F5_ACESA|nr:hypothetical protein LWI29_038328 [Acer saccharum]
MGRRKGTVEFDETAPDDFDPANPYKDPVAMLEMREHIESTISRNAVTLSNSTSTPPVASDGARTAATPLFTVPSRSPSTPIEFDRIRELPLASGGMPKWRGSWSSLFVFDIDSYLKHFFSNVLL